MGRNRPISRIVIALSLLLTFCTVFSFFGTFFWVADYFALLPSYYFWGGLVLLLGLVALREWRWIKLLLALTLVNGWLLSGYWFDGGEISAEAPDLRIFVHNIYFENTDLDAIRREVDKYNPDVVFLMEYSFDIQQQIEEQFADYPYQLIEPSRFTMGLALFSKIPFENTTIHRRQATRIPIFEVEMLIDDQPVSFVGGHPWPPFPQWGGLHRSQMADIATVAERAAAPLIVAGDFNASQWSYTVGHVMDLADVHDASLGFGYRPTWQQFPLLRLPFDHVLISDEWLVHNYLYGDAGGSDHVPLIVDLSLAAAD